MHTTNWHRGSGVFSYRTSDHQGAVQLSAQQVEETPYIQYRGWSPSSNPKSTGPLLHAHLLFLSTILSIKSKKNPKIYLKKPPASQQCSNRKRKFQLTQCIDFQIISPQTTDYKTFYSTPPLFLSSPERCTYMWQPSQSCIREQTLVFKTWELGHCKDKAVQSERSCTILPWG